MLRRFFMTVAAGSLFVGGLAASHLAFAQPGPGGPGRDGPGFGGPRGGFGELLAAGSVTKAELTASLEARFARLDLNRDGKLDKADRDLFRQQRIDARFAAMDTDRNGQISKAEFAAAADAHFDKHGEPGKPGGPGKPDGRGPEGREGPHGFGGPGGHRMSGGMSGGFGGRFHGGPEGPGKDGVITKAEFMARPLAMFDKADANHDGRLTAEELRAARETMRAEWRDHKGPPPPPPAAPGK